MANFGKSLKEGLEASKVAESKKAEIDAVFAELREQTLAATGGKVGIRVGSYRKKQPPPMRPAVLAAAGMEHAPVYFEQRQLLAFSAEGADRGTHLADLEVAATGYPVSLTLPDGVDTRAYDRASLEAALAMLLAHPTVGTAIRPLLEPEPPKKTG